MTCQDPSTDIEVLREAIDKLTRRLVVLEAANLGLRREIESMRAWNNSAFREVTKWATGHL